MEVAKKYLGAYELEIIEKFCRTNDAAIIESEQITLKFIIKDGFVSTIDKIVVQSNSFAIAYKLCFEENGEFKTVSFSKRLDRFTFCDEQEIDTAFFWYPKFLINSERNLKEIAKELRTFCNNADEYGYISQPNILLLNV